jgi:hypothetical protein
LARLLQFKIELLNGSCLLYNSKSRIQSLQVYGQTIKFLFDLKQKNKYAKKIMSSLWGSHCEKNIVKKTIYYEGNDEIFDDTDLEIVSIKKLDKKIKINFERTENIFKLPYARMGTFLTSYARFQFVKRILSNNFDTKNIKYINTDGFVIQNETLKDDEIGIDMGKFKIEKTGNCELKYTNTAIIWS